MIPRIALISAGMLVVACPKDPASTRPKFVGDPRPVQLFTAVPEAETSTRAERRPDVMPLGEGTEATVAVLAKFEGDITLGGGRARLFGDDKGTEGWNVDNAILFEVLGPGGAVTHRFAVGYHDGLRVGSEEVDNFGRKTFRFAAGEVDITPLLPESGTFKLRATAIDTGTVGQVSNVFLIIGPPGPTTPDDLQNK